MDSKRTDTDRRRFMTSAAMGLAAFGSGGLTLRADARPTPAQGDADYAKRVLSLFGQTPEPVVTEEPIEVSPRQGRGPSYLPRAPFRGKVSPMMAKGVPLFVQGHVWGHDTKQALVGAILDVFQASPEGVYSPGGDDWSFRTRLLTSETGYYEYETIHPPAYEFPAAGSGRWRSPHVHMVVNCPGYAELATELMFTGDPKADVDFVGRPSELVKTPEKVEIEGVACERVWFDVVLAPR